MSLAEAGEFYGPVQAFLRQKFGEKGDEQFYELLRFMTGRWRPEVPETGMDAEGSVRCLALIYAGKDAVNKLRAILGPTDPAKAPPGSVRKEFGQDIMVNAAHASDSPENARREMAIIKPGRNLLKTWFDRYYA